LLDGAAGGFGADSASEAAEPAIDAKTLPAKIGELTLLGNFLSGARGSTTSLSSAYGVR